MNFLISLLTLTSLVLSLNTSLQASGDLPTVGTDCELLQQLNMKMDDKVQLTDSQRETVLLLNESYWAERHQITNSLGTIGKNTDLLRCWDDWRRELSTQFTTTQMENFLRWQSATDLLGERPF